MSNIRLPISIRLTLWYGLSLLSLLTVFGTFLYIGFHVGLHLELEGEMNQARDLLLPNINVEGPVPALHSSDVAGLVGHSSGSDATFVRIVSIEGVIVYRSPNFEGRFDFNPGIQSDPDEGVFDHVWEAAPTRSEYTIIRDGSGAQKAWLEISRAESAIHNELHRLQWLILGGVLFGMLVALVVGYWLARRALRPVALLTDGCQADPRVRSGEPPAH